MVPCNKSWSHISTLLFLDFMMLYNNRWIKSSVESSVDDVSTGLVQLNYPSCHSWPLANLAYFIDQTMAVCVNSHITKAHISLVTNLTFSCVPGASRLVFIIHYRRAVTTVAICVNVFPLYTMLLWLIYYPHYTSLYMLPTPCYNNDAVYNTIHLLAIL